MLKTRHSVVFSNQLFNHRIILPPRNCTHSSWILNKMAFLSLCISSLPGWDSQDELQKLSTKPLAQVQPRQTFIATCCFPLLLNGIWNAPLLSELSPSVSMWGFPGRFLILGSTSVSHVILMRFHPLTCSSLFCSWPPQTSWQNRKAGATAGSSFSSHIFYLQRVSKKQESCSSAGT